MSHLSLRAHIGELQLHAQAVIERGITHISGPNGAGKTSLLRCLAGLEPARGELVVDGRCWLDEATGQCLPVAQRDLGCAWSDPALLPWLTVRSNIMLADPPPERVWLRRLLRMLELESLASRLPHMLSTGEAQRVAVARALARRPALLLLDEPFSAQAPALRRRLCQAVRILTRECVTHVLIVSHDEQDARRMADHHWHMRAGRLFTTGGSMEYLKERSA